MSSVTQRHSDIDGVVAQLHAAAGITDIAYDYCDKLLNAARHLARALKNPVHKPMTIVKWGCLEYPITARSILDPEFA